MWTTVATSYPAKGEKSWLNFSGSMKTTTGKAATMALGGKFRAGGTKSTTDGWGEDFEPTSSNRAYFISIMYGVSQCWNTITGYSWYKTEPLYQTGGTTTQKIPTSDRPKWTMCRPTSNGTWWRGKQKGQDYTLSYGVRIKQAIGIDLYSQHGYSQSGRLNFTVHHGNKRMCGEKVYPAVAPKLVQRLR